MQEKQIYCQTQKFTRLADNIYPESNVEECKAHLFTRDLKDTDKGPEPMAMSLTSLYEKVKGSAMGDLRIWEEKA